MAYVRGHERPGGLAQGGIQSSCAFLYLGKARGLTPLPIALEMNNRPRVLQQKRIIEIWGRGSGGKGLGVQA